MVSLSNYFMTFIFITLLGRSKTCPNEGNMRALHWYHRGALKGVHFFERKW